METVIWHRRLGTSITMAGEARVTRRPHHEMSAEAERQMARLIGVDNACAGAGKFEAPSWKQTATSGAVA